jgi:hypothetical protein
MKNEKSNKNNSFQSLENCRGFEFCGTFYDSATKLYDLKVPESN